jgi:hypothetical protein
MPTVSYETEERDLPFWRERNGGGLKGVGFS